MTYATAPADLATQLIDEHNATGGPHRMNATPGSNIFAAIMQAIQWLQASGLDIPAIVTQARGLISLAAAEKWQEFSMALLALGLSIINKTPLPTPAAPSAVNMP